MGESRAEPVTSLFLKSLISVSLESWKERHAGLLEHRVDMSGKRVKEISERNALAFDAVPFAIAKYDRAKREAGHRPVFIPSRRSTGSS